jgi:TonB family protein
MLRAEIPGGKPFMKYPLHFGIVTYLICSAFLFAQSNPSSTEQKQEPPSGAGLQRPTGPFIRICSDKNPPPCATPPHAVYAPDPEYSKEAKDAHFEGTCVLWVVVGADGDVHNLKVVRGLGHGLDKKAVETVKGWRFEPAQENGQPVAVQVNVEVSFRLYANSLASNSPQSSRIIVSPVSTWVVAGSQEQFSAQVPGVSNPSLTWSVSGDGCAGSRCGIIAANGLYTAPSNVPDFPTVIVTVTLAGDPVKIGSATVNIKPSPSR